MEEELISKKELLERYGISYGALYRWKRMGLIPEAWFLRRSTSTGQETFFRRELICQRVELILEQKERQSLEALAATLAEKRQAGAVRRLVVETAFGRREYPLEELNRLYLSDGNQQRDLLEELRELSLR